MMVATHPPLRLSAKAVVGRAMFRLAGVDRTHIIGCSRSGTTMLHLAMVRFRDVVLARAETEISHPYLSDRLRIGFDALVSGKQQHYVTKRNYDWFEPRNVDLAISYVLHENIALIDVVRDPRDVLLSRYTGSKSEAQGRTYVTAEHWYRSILAEERMLAALDQHARKVVLRYEDMIIDPAGTEARIVAALGLGLDPRTKSLDHVKDNFALVGARFDEEEIKALGGLRNMDPGSIGRWKQGSHDNLARSLEPHVRARMAAFCEEHGYDPL
jgi:hypothetical protein